jgi:hypothetical protein
VVAITLLGCYGSLPEVIKVEFKVGFLKHISKNIVVICKTCVREVHGSNSTRTPIIMADDFRDFSQCRDFPRPSALYFTVCNDTVFFSASKQMH